ncbi:MAG: hypothetical protein ABH986_03690 [archaeon]
MKEKRYAYNPDGTVDYFTTIRSLPLSKENQEDFIAYLKSKKKASWGTNFEMFIRPYSETGAFKGKKTTDILPSEFTKLLTEMINSPTCYGQERKIGGKKTVCRLIHAYYRSKLLDADNQELHFKLTQICNIIKKIDNNMKNVEPKYDDKDYDDMIWIMSAVGPLLHGNKRDLILFRLAIDFGHRGSQITGLKFGDVAPKYEGYKKEDEEKASKEHRELDPTAFDIKFKPQKGGKSSEVRIENGFEDFLDYWKTIKKMYQGNPDAPFFPTKSKKSRLFNSLTDGDFRALFRNYIRKANKLYSIPLDKLNRPEKAKNALYGAHVLRGLSSTQQLSEGSSEDEINTIQGRARGSVSLRRNYVDLSKKAVKLKKAKEDALKKGKDISQFEDFNTPTGICLECWNLKFNSETKCFHCAEDITKQNKAVLAKKADELRDLKEMKEITKEVFALLASPSDEFRHKTFREKYYIAIERTGKRRGWTEQQVKTAKMNVSNADGSFLAEQRPKVTVASNTTSQE